MKEIAYENGPSPTQRRQCSSITRNPVLERLSPGLAQSRILSNRHARQTREDLSQIL